MAIVTHPAPDSNGSPNPFLTMDGNGKPVRDRFTSAWAVRRVYRQMQYKDEEEANRRLRIRRVYDLYFPYDPVKRKAKGLGNLANFNSGELKGTIDARAASIQDLALDTTPLVELRPLPAEQAGPDAEKIAEVVSDEFSSTLRDSRKFLPALSTVVKEADLYGLGPVSWTTKDDYIPVALERGQVKFDENASAVSSDNELYIIESFFPVRYLVDLFDNPDGSLAEGWNLPAVKDYLIKTFEEHQDNRGRPADNEGTSPMESAEALWRQNRYLESRQFDILRVLHVYAKEVVYPYKITHYILTPTDNVDDFLFVRKSAYDNMDQCFMWLPYTVTERHARSVRGLASFLLPIVDVNNRFLCQLFDAAFRSASFILTSNAPANNQQITVLEHGPYLVVPNGLTPSQSQVSPNFQQLAAVRELGRNVAMNNASGSLGVAAMPERVYSGADRKTKEQIRAESDAGSKVEQSLYILRVTIFDAIFRESFRRFMNLVLDKSTHSRYPEVADFIDRCARRGVGLDLLGLVPDQFRIRKCRDLVTGGAAAKAGILTDLLTTLGGNLDEVGRVAATRDVVLARLGQKAADRYRPETGRDTVPSDAASHAILENNDMSEEQQVLCASEQLHWTHIPVHGQLVQSIVQAVQQGQIDDPQHMLKVLQLVLGHVQQHISFGGQQLGMQGAAKQAMGSIRSLAPIIRTLTLAAESQDKAQEAQQKQQEQQMQELQQQASGADQQVKIHKIDSDAQLKARAQDLDNQVKMEGVRQKASVDLLRAQSKNEIDRTVANMRRYVEAQKAVGNPPPQTSGLTGGETGGTGLAPENAM